MDVKAFLLVQVIFTSGTLAFKWTSRDLSDGAIVSACQGQPVSLSWKYTADTAERVISIEWIYLGKGEAESILASRVRGQFLIKPAVFKQISFLPNAGIKLVNVTSEDSGQYSVKVNVNLRGSTVTHWQNVTVTVADPPALLNDELHVYMPPSVVYDNDTDQWHAQLSCGDFVSRGNPPVDVFFTTPCKKTYNDTYYNNGSFTFSLPNPVTGGFYTCQLADGPSTACLKSTAPSLHKASTRVHGTEVQLDVTSAQLAALQAENLGLQSELQAEREAHFNCTQQVEDLTSPLQNATQTFRDCGDVLKYSRESGVYTVYVEGKPLNVYCDQDTDGGGWTVFQRRQDGSVNFTRHYREFEAGFGHLRGEFWLGLRHIHQLTSQAEYDLRVDMEDFEHNSTYALYNRFSIADGTDKYRLHLGSLVTGPSANNYHMSYNNGQQFSALGNDNSGRNCVAARRGTGWWFNYCTYVNPNGLYLHGYEASASGHSESKILWDSFRGFDYSLKRIEMKVRKHIR